MEDRIKKFLSIDDSCYNYDDYVDNGYGCGYYYTNNSEGCGCGHGYGCGNERGRDYGNGCSYGDGDYNIKEYNNQKVYIIDEINTLIDSVHDNYAKGRILNQDFTTKECFIAKVNNKYFAHGETLHKAFEDAHNKAFQDLPIELRISKFKEQYPNKNIKIPAKELYEWHNKLTGSCEMGRCNFIKEHNIDIDNDSFTIEEFVNIYL